MADPDRHAAECRNTASNSTASDRTRRRKSCRRGTITALMRGEGGWGPPTAAVQRAWKGQAGSRGGASRKEPDWKSGRRAPRDAPRRHSGVVAKGISTALAAHRKCLRRFSLRVVWLADAWDEVLGGDHPRLSLTPAIPAASLASDW